MLLTRGGLVLAFVCLGGGVASADAIDDYVRAQMQEFNLPGVSIAIVDQGKVVRAGGYGMADPARQVAATPDTVYKIASVSKQFMATAILLLAQEGKLSVDDPVGRHLTHAPAAWQGVTIRHLLTHTSGIVRESPAFRPMETAPDLAIIEGAYGEPVRSAPGTKWEYCNVGYYVLGEIVARMSSRPWAAFIKTRIFDPAGMTETVPTNAVPRPARHAVGYGGKDNKTAAEEWVALRPSGAFASTVSDLARWDAVLGSDRLLTAASKRDMWTRVRLNDGATYPYGFGLHVDTLPGGRRVAWHSGGLPGFASHYGRYLDEGVTVIVLTNGNDADPTAIGRGLADRYLASRSAAAAPGR
jgi:CubicO group peptidase (beta-lactamase class C family)